MSEFSNVDVDLQCFFPGTNRCVVVTAVCTLLVKVGNYPCSVRAQSSELREFGLGGQVFPFRVSPPQKPPHVVARHVLLFCAFIAFHFTPMLCTSPLAIPSRKRQQARDKERIVCDAIYSGKQTLFHTTPPPRTINIWTCSLGSLHVV
jgi:hypothetical protein